MSSLRTNDRGAAPDLTGQSGATRGDRREARAAAPVLAFTNLYPVPWDETRGTFNEQQFTRLAQRVALSVVVALPVQEVLANPAAALKALVSSRPGSVDVRYFVYVNLPRALGWANSLAFLVCLCAQRPVTVLLKRWSCLIGSWLFPDAVATAAIGWIRRIPWVAVALGTDGNLLSRMPRRRGQIRRMLEGAHRVVTVSEALRGVLLETGASMLNSEVLYTGVDPKRFHPLPRDAARRQLGLPADARVVLFIGSMIPTKGIDELAEAMVRLTSEDRSWHLVAIGSGPARASTQATFAAAGISDHLHCPGKVPNDALAGWFAAADLFCLPSHREGVPNVVLEAMACGVPVVATRVGGIPEVVPGFAGILVEPQAVPELEVALRAGVGREWNRAAIVEHSRRFCWDANADRLAEIVRSAAVDRAARVAT
jgi:glycosyltransferase involved in cell wall biosynthesis